MKKSILKSLTIAGLGSFCAFVAHAATSLFSDYGQIQNVQNYSSNPFWTPNAPYNQRLPQPVYVQGADLNTEDCMRAVQSLVSVQCMARNNCRNTTLNEIRPTIMVQLSNLPGNNYVSACSGYIDGVFESYVAQYGNGVSGRAVSFPTGTVANPTVNADTGLQLKNPYKQTVSKKQAAINERAEELQRLQEQNGSGSESLSSSAFPTTYADFSFSQRVENTREGLMPYKDMKAYQTPKILGCEEWCDDHANSPECITCRAKAADCTDTLNRFEGDHIVRAEWGTKTKVVGRVCKIVLCESGWEPDTHGEKCIQHKGTDCTEELKDIEHIHSAEIDENGKCVVKTCDEGYQPNATLDACEEKPAEPEPYVVPDDDDGGNGGGDDDTPPSKDDSNGTYTLKICFHSSESKNINQCGTKKVTGTAKGFMFSTCYSLCDKTGKYNYKDAVNTVFEKILGTKYCIMPGSTDHIPVSTSDYETQISIPGDKKDAIIEELNKISDEYDTWGPCDFVNVHNIDVHIINKDDNSYETIRLDD